MNFSTLFAVFGFVIIFVFLWHTIIEPHIICNDNLPEEMELQYSISNYYPSGVKCIFESKKEADFERKEVILQRTKNHGWVEK